MLINIVHDLKHNVPLFMIQNKYKISGADVLKIIENLKDEK